VNQGAAQVFGGSLTAATELSHDELVVRPSVAYTFTEGDRDGIHVSLPHHNVKGIVEMTWRELTMSVRVHARSRTSSGIHFDAAGNRATSPGSAVTHLHASWSDLNPFGDVRARVFTSIDNLFDQRYFHFSDGIETFRATPQDPFRILVGVEVQH
jgi:hypothetical protein